MIQWKRLTDIECYLVLRFIFPSFPERLWSVMTGSEVSHGVMTQTDPDPGDRRHCVSGTSPASLWRAKVQWLQHWAPLRSASGILPGCPGLGEHVKDEGPLGQEETTRGGIRESTDMAGIITVDTSAGCSAAEFQSCRDQM